jgi:hypothetical protein
MGILKHLFPKVKNPLVEDNLSNRFNEWLCGKNFKNCIMIGEYYGMPQSYCKRCGHKNHGIASDGVKEWNLPDRLDKR